MVGRTIGSCSVSEIDHLVVPLCLRFLEEWSGNLRWRSYKSHKDGEGRKPQEGGMKVTVLKHFFKILHAVCYTHYIDESSPSHSEMDAIIPYY